MRFCDEKCINNQNTKPFFTSESTLAVIIVFVSALNGRTLSKLTFLSKVTHQIHMWT